MHLRYIFDASEARGWCIFAAQDAKSGAWPTCSKAKPSPRESPRRPMRRWPTGCGPQSLDDIVGQEHLTGPDGAIGRMVAAGKLELDDPVGPARHRQDQHRPAARRCGRPAVRRHLGRLLGRRRPQETVRRSQDGGAAPASAPCCSSTRSTASIAPSRTASCPMSRTAPSPWSARPPRTPASSSTRRCCRAARC